MKERKEEILNSKKILITSHTNCDQDGICSALATKLILEKNFPKKKFDVCIESELQKNISFLKDFSKIESGNLFKKVKSYKPDLIIFTDSTSLERYTHESKKLQEIIQVKNIRTILIDHHKTKTNSSFDIVFNNFRSSCAEEIYHCFVKEMKLKIDTNIAEIILTGMIFDTGVFSYKNKFFRQTANTVVDLVELGANIEKILSYKNIYSEKDFEVFTELNKNLIIKKGFCYSIITEEFFKNCKLSSDEYKHAYQSWVELFLKKVEGCPWGFIVRPTERGEYSATFRSQQGFQNVRILAEQLGGGGHDYASGATIKEKNIKSVIEKILSKIT
jgi:bifunctional oligoribonuclease and PAP phosphatase NrnA